VSTAAQRARSNLLAGGCFLLGGSLFAVGAFLAQTGAELIAVNVTYLVGGVFFSLGGWLSILAATGGRARSSAVVLFVGTCFFGVSLVAAFATGLTPRQADNWIWLPDITGCVCFLVSGHLAMLDVGHGHIRVLPTSSDWWIVLVNQLGSVVFFLAGLASFVRPATSEAVNIGLVNWGTFSGALCFAVAGVIQMGGGLARGHRAPIGG
jgi:hypothetical protein